jgi:hypothetical protein
MQFITHTGGKQPITKPPTAIIHLTNSFYFDTNLTKEQYKEYIDNPSNRHNNNLHFTNITLHLDRHHAGILIDITINTDNIACITLATP